MNGNEGRHEIMRGHLGWVNFTVRIDVFTRIFPLPGSLHNKAGGKQTAVGDRRPI